MRTYEEYLKEVSDIYNDINEEMTESQIVWSELKIQELTTEIETHFRFGEMSINEHRVLNFCLLSTEEELRHVKRKQGICRRFANESLEASLGFNRITDAKQTNRGTSCQNQQD